jgi:hypothetical protein
MPLKQYWKKKNLNLSHCQFWSPICFQATKLIFFIWNQALIQHRDFHLDLESLLESKLKQIIKLNPHSTQYTRTKLKKKNWWSKWNKIKG